MVGSNNGLVPTRWQANIWTNDVLSYWRIYASLEFDADNIDLYICVIFDLFACISGTHKTCWCSRHGWNALRWRHNGHDGVSNHQPRDCLLNRLFRRRSKKTSKLRVTGLCAGNSPGTGEFPAQMASNAENVSISWRHHGFNLIYYRSATKLNKTQTMRIFLVCTVDSMIRYANLSGKLTGQVAQSQMISYRLANLSTDQIYQSYSHHADFARPDWAFSPNSLHPEDSGRTASQKQVITESSNEPIPYSVSGHCANQFWPTINANIKLSNSIVKSAY